MSDWKQVATEPVRFRDIGREPHPTNCGDCGRLHLNGEHIVVNVPMPEPGAIRKAWEGCVDCWVKRTNPDPTPVSRRTETTEG